MRLGNSCPSDIGNLPTRGSIDQLRKYGNNAYSKWIHYAIIRTVVRIHINAATFAPIAQAPAMPPRAAEAADFSTISRKDNCFFAGAIDVSLLLMIDNAIRVLFV
jgi:hypothetical protein